MKALTKRTNCTFTAKKSGGARPKKIPDQCPPLSNSFRRNWPYYTRKTTAFCRVGWGWDYMDVVSGFPVVGRMGADMIFIHQPKPAF